MRSQPAIRAQHIGKMFRVGAVHDPTRFAGILNTVGRKLGLRDDARSQSVEFWALQDVSFEVAAGESLGIVGGNGAGKSTLLKILSRITGPTTGQVDVWGRMASLLEVGTGFMPVLTGRENVYLNGALLGMSRAEIKSKFDEIVAFAEVEQFIDTPVQRYSSGMSIRLAFSIAAHLQPAVLVIDEVLAVGDYRFQLKCRDVMESYVAAGGTVLLVAHDTSLIESFCTNALWLRGGRCVMHGPAADVTSSYMEWSAEPLNHQGQLAQSVLSTTDRMNNLQGLEISICWETGYITPRVDLVHNWYTEDAIAVSGHFEIEEGQPYVLAVTYDGKAKHESLRLFVNGEKEGHVFAVGGRGLQGTTSTSRAMYVGARAGQASQFYGGIEFLGAVQSVLPDSEIVAQSREHLADWNPEGSDVSYWGVQPDITPEIPVDTDLPFTVFVALQRTPVETGLTSEPESTGDEVGETEPDAVGHAST